MATRDGLLSGTVTFLFTDIEGSTGLLKGLGRDQYETVLAEHAGLLRAAVVAHGGRVVDTQGDALFCAFGSARQGVSAAIEGQRQLAAHEWPEQTRVRVRMGLHSGEPKAGEERYVGIGVHRAARIGACAHGEQIVVSETTRALVADDLPSGISLRDLGDHRLKDIDEPLRLYQVLAAGLADRFPPLRTLPRRRSRRAYVVLAAVALVVAAGAVAAVLQKGGSASAKPVRLVENSIAVLDPKSGKPVGDVPLGFSPTDVNAGGNSIWVLNRSAKTATAIDPGTLRVVRTVGLGGDPDSQYATANTEWVATAGGVEEIDENADSNSAVKITLWGPTGGATHCLAYVTGNGRTVWVSEGTHVAVLDLTGHVRRKLRLPVPAGFPAFDTCYGLRYAGGVLLAIRNDFSIGTPDLKSQSYTPVATNAMINTQQNFGSANWTAGFGSYWIGTQTQDSKTDRIVPNLTRLDPISGEVTASILNPVGFFNLTVDPQSGIWSIGSVAAPKSYAQLLRSAAAARTDPKTGDIASTTQLHHVPCCPNGSVGNGIAAGHNHIWVALDSP